MVSRLEAPILSLDQSSSTLTAPSRLLHDARDHEHRGVVQQAGVAGVHLGPWHHVLLAGLVLQGEGASATLLGQHRFYGRARLLTKAREFLIGNQVMLSPSEEVE